MFNFCPLDNIQLIFQIRNRIIWNWTPALESDLKSFKSSLKSHPLWVTLYYRSMVRFISAKKSFYRRLKMFIVH